MKFIAINFNTDPSWIKDYTDDFVILDRSDNGIDYGLPVTKTENKGHCDYDKLTWLVENYDNLPDIFYWGKVNLWKSITKEEFKEALVNNDFCPLLTQNHKTYSDSNGVVCFYDKNGMYNERADSWICNVLEHKNIDSWEDWLDLFPMISYGRYIPFAPGGNFILTKERVHRHPKEMYDKMRLLLPYSKNPAEAHCAERSYYLLWK